MFRTQFQILTSCWKCKNVSPRNIAPLVKPNLVFEEQLFGGVMEVAEERDGQEGGRKSWVMVDGKEREGS